MAPVSRNRRLLSRLAAVTALGLFLHACASSGALATARTAESNQDYDAAVAAYSAALRKEPNNKDARLGLDRAKIRASQDHFARGRRLVATGKLEEALMEYQIAAELTPASGDIQTELRTVRTQLRNQIAVREDGKTRLEALIDQSRTAPLPGTDLPEDVTLPDSLVFRDASARDIFSAIARFANISIVFDPTYRDQVVSIDLRKTPLDQALTSVTNATRTFWHVTTPRTVTIIPDSQAKRREYEEEVVRTFYLSNADLKETIDIMRIVVDARRIAAMTATNAITIKDTPERVAAAGRIISAIDKARPEVVIDVELLEVDRTHLNEYGLQIASPATNPTGINGQADINKEGFTLRDLTRLTQSDVYLTNLPALYYRLLKTDGATRILANPQLRTAEGAAAQARFGERVPVPVTTFAPIAQGGVQTQPITSFNYENIGVNIDITPRTHHDDAVSLAVKVELSSISGTGFGGLPTFGNRSINTVIRLKDGETNMLAGLIRDEERKSLAGVAGLSDLPLIGRLFAYNSKETKETDIILTLTPHIVRVLDLTPVDLAAFRVGRDGAGGGVDLPPLPVPPGQQQQPPRPPNPPNPGDAAQPAGPVLAPTVPATPGPATPLKPPPPPPTRPGGSRE
ncbi:MAG TPA: secretin N-terminal domain-containing protein [Vicinamibacterales bacterium]|nr:secretin N-terminal domain-containing protein [Vicinamibacterales bacterium]